MATVRTRLLKIGASTLTMVYDDAKQDPDPEIDIDPCDLIRYELIAAEPVRGEVYRRANGNVWRDFDVPIGSYTYEAGGPVQQVGDISRIWLGTV